MPTSSKMNQSADDYHGISDDAFVSFFKSSGRSVFSSGSRNPTTGISEALQKILAGANPRAFDDDRIRIFDNPHKGRRITLFHGIPESFEESPWPVDTDATAPNGSAKFKPIVVAPPKRITLPTMEQARQATTFNEPPSEEEFTKLKRLATFHEDPPLLGLISKLAIVDLPSLAIASWTMRPQKRKTWHSNEHLPTLLRRTRRR
ncbi:hypothetical protein DL96DRAFT_353152 [Flagelloscypha sp. PMI_526]|nr:hypothetical protein DL96DRAFT_353152 [Flagelloscypha sp. PMI_526]